MFPVRLFPSPTVFLQLGPLVIRWYALAYIAGLVSGWRLVRRLVLRAPAVASSVQVDDFLTWATLGVVLGGRLGYVLFYKPLFFLSEPLQIVAVWQGGMSFHGGMLGVAIAVIWFCRREKIPILGFADRVAVAAPIGLGLGRIANFVNGELWGRPAPEWLPWAMRFPASGDDLLRHPSQLYEAALEGVVLFLILQLGLRVFGWHRRPGLLAAVFFAGYGLFRFVVEFFREPDAPFLGFLTMGMALSLLTWIAAALLFRAALKPKTA